MSGPLDDHSRFVVSARVVARATARPVCGAFELAMDRHGVPDGVLTGAPVAGAIKSTR